MVGGGADGDFSDVDCTKKGAQGRHTQQPRVPKAVIGRPGL